MTGADRTQSPRLYVGVDIGGTKILANLVTEAGQILGRCRERTPRDASPDETVGFVEQTIADLLGAQGIGPADLTAIGVAAPGVVDADAGLVVFTPNMNLTGVPLGRRLAQTYALPVALGNDCNVGTMGEKWLGSARWASSVFGMFVGTGIGGGIVYENKVIRGCRKTAAEVGHLIMEVDGPVCGCGNKGCFEALASRSAIERDIRKAVKDGKKTILTKLLDGDLRVIRSGALRKAVSAGDELVTKVLKRAGKILGLGCLTVRHLLDPEAIVLGGGVMEAVGEMLMPIIEGVLADDGLTGANDNARVLMAALGDDAVAVGAVALAREAAGRSPFDPAHHATPAYPVLRVTDAGGVAVGEAEREGDFCLLVSGHARRRKRTGRKIKGKDVARACEGGPELLLVGTSEGVEAVLDEDARKWLTCRAVEVRMSPLAEAVEAYNRSDVRRAGLFVLGKK